jgi:hypothetical protein
MSKGDRCLEVKDGMGWIGYCEECGRGMIEACRVALEGLASRR